MRRGNARDGYGHGTHVAGIIAESRRDGYGGMAPGAWIANLRVLGADGSGKTDAVIDAIDWAIQNRQRYNIRIINLSLGHPVFESYLDDPLCQAAQRAVDAGLVVVAAAGNFGKTDDGRPVVGGIVAPGNTPSVLTVGAINTQGYGAAVRRRDGDLQLARADADRRRAQAGAGGAGQPDRGGVGGGELPGDDVSGAGGAWSRTVGLPRVERHEHVDRGGLGRGRAACWQRAVADAGAGQGGAAADGVAGGGGWADRGGRGQSECGGSGGTR